MSKAPTLHDIDTQMAALLAQKATLERQAASLLVPLYGEIAERLLDADVSDLLVDVGTFQEKLAEGTIAYQQLGHVFSVIRDVTTFFTAEKERLMALTVEPAPVITTSEI